MTPAVPRRPKFRSAEFGEWIKEIRGKRSAERIAIGMRVELGRTMVLNRSTIEKIESGQVPNWVELAALIKVLDLPFADVLERLMLAVTVDGGERVFPEVPRVRHITASLADTASSAGSTQSVVSTGHSVIRDASKESDNNGTPSRLRDERSDVDHAVSALHGATRTFQKAMHVVERILANTVVAELSQQTSAPRTPRAGQRKKP